jgi:hypothetical protein
MTEERAEYKVKKRPAGATYWKRVYRIAGGLSLIRRCKIALKIIMA